MTERERLIELFKDFSFKCVEPCDKQIKQSENIIVVNCERCKYEQLADYLLAEGVIVPPCKVGDVVYSIHNGKVFGGEITMITIIGNRLRFVATGGRYFLGDEDIGKTVFLTKEEAEQSLKGGAEQCEI